jgi:circadian clock protein KaiC
MTSSASLCTTGVPGLDDILGGGLPRNCLYLVDGNPGVGKTTLALQFLLQGLKEKERCLYITLSETKPELDAVARSHGWSLEGIDIIELSAIERSLAGKSQNTMFQSAEVELNHLSKLLLEEVERIRPSRVVLDSLSEMRLRRTRCVIAGRSSPSSSALPSAAARYCCSMTAARWAPTSRCTASCTAWSRW